MKRKIQFMAMLLIGILLSVNQVWAEKITDYSNIVSGQKYYIGATSSSTDYYLSVNGSSTSTSIAGTAVTSKASATAFVFEGSGTSWTIKFDGTSNYLGLKSSRDNGKVQVVSSAATFTLSNQSGKIRLTIGSYSVQKNNSGTQFGSYANTQTDVWLEPANYTVVFKSPLFQLPIHKIPASFMLPYPSFYHPSDTREIPERYTAHPLLIQNILFLRFPQSLSSLSVRRNIVSAFLQIPLSHSVRAGLIKRCNRHISFFFSHNINVHLPFYREE